MRTLLYGMQSSGGSWIALAMAQHTERIVVMPDLLRAVMPPAEEMPTDVDVIVKATVQNGFPIEDMAAKFKPDRIVLVHRNQVDVKQSLWRRHEMATYRGSFLHRGMQEIEKKLATMRKTMDRASRLGAEIIRYEEVAADPPPMRRRYEYVAAANHELCRWCRPNSRPQRWAFGGIHYPQAMIDSYPKGVWMHRMAWLIRYYGRCLDGEIDEIGYHPGVFEKLRTRTLATQEE